MASQSCYPGHRPRAGFYKLIFCTIQVRPPSSKYLKGLEIIMPGECFVRMCWVLGSLNSENVLQNLINIDELELKMKTGK